MSRSIGSRSILFGGILALALGGTLSAAAPEGAAAGGGKSGEAAKAADSKAGKTGAADTAQTGGSMKAGDPKAGGGAAAGDAKAGGAGKTGDAKADAKMSPELAKAVAKVQGAYSKLQSLQASFTQSSKLSSSSKARIDSGTVEFKKGKMRWDFEKPDVRHFISDGKTLWIYSPKDKQVMETALTSQASQTALNFMSGLGDLGRDFKPALAGEAEFQRPGMLSLHLVPKESIGTLKKLTILVSEEDGIVREAYIKDPMGATTHVEFKDLKINAPIADTRFSFKAPAGVEVLRPQGF